MGPVTSAMAMREAYGEGSQSFELKIRPRIVQDLVSCYNSFNSTQPAGSDMLRCASPSAGLVVGGRRKAGISSYGLVPLRSRTSFSTVILWGYIFTGLQRRSTAQTYLRF